MAEQSFPFAAPAAPENPSGVVNSEERYRRMARWFREDGVVDGYLENLEVTYAGFTVTVRPGAAFVNGVYYENTAPLQLALAAATQATSRVDRVILRLDVAGKRVTAAVKQGTAGSVAPPALTRTASVWEVTLDEVLVNASGGFDASGQRYDRWSYGDRRSGRPPGWLVGLASGTLLPRGQLTRLGITADAEAYGAYQDGLAGLTFGASASGIRIRRDGIYQVSISGRIEGGTKDAPETVLAEQQRISGGTWVRIGRVGGPDNAVASTGLLNCLAGDAIVPFAYQNHTAGTWRLTDRLGECRFSGLWMRDYGGE
jgi:hypothetical protein